MMKKTGRRTLALLLCLTMAFSLLSLTAFADDDETDTGDFQDTEEAEEEEVTLVASGTCGAADDGSNLTWELDSAGTLTISGEGAMADYASYNAAPWSNYSGVNTDSVYVQTIVVESGVTTIGAYAFSGMKATLVIISDTVKSIGEMAFYDDSNIGLKIVFTGEAPELADNFLSAYGVTIYYPDYETWDKSVTNGSYGVSGNNTTWTAYHIWDEVVWDWSDDYTEAAASRTCQNCGETETAEAEVDRQNYVAPTCTEDGSAFCAAVAVFTFEENETEYRCEMDVTYGALGHSWDDGEVTKEVTLTEDGEMLYTCTVCGETKTETIWAESHEWGEISWAVSKDYTEATASRVCADCGAVQSVVAAVTSETTEPTCEQAGKTVYTATATFDGEPYTYTVEQWIDAPGHVWNDGVVTKQATETENGEIVYTCTVCGETRSEVIPADNPEAQAEAAAISALRVLCESSLENLYEVNYTPESWEILKYAQLDAEAILDTEDASTEDIMSVWAALYEAVADLELDPSVTEVNKDALYVLWEGLTALDETMYSEESWAEITDLAERMEAVLLDENATQEDVDAMIQEARGIADTVADGMVAAAAGDDDITYYDSASGYASPKTNDGSAPYLAVCLLILSAGAMAVLILPARKRVHTNR